MADMTLACLLCTQTAALRAHSFLAYTNGMSRHSLRGALHFELLATAILRPVKQEG